MILLGGNVSILSHDICRLIIDHDPAHTRPSIICDFHFSVDFRLDILFPHIFWCLHQNWVGIDGFTLTKLRHVEIEEKTIPSWLDTSSPTIAPPVLLQSAFCALKKTDWLKLDRFKFLILDILIARRVSALRAQAGKPVRTDSDGVVWNLTQHFR